jgi:mono/diheme cytochrome c family protein
MTEVPEYLLERSRARRAALGLGGGDAPATASGSGDGGPGDGGSVDTSPATAAPAAGAPAAAPAPAPAPTPTEKLPTYVAPAGPRSGIPVWMMPVILILPLWAIVYLGAFGESSTAAGPATGQEIFQRAGCVNCHGAQGQGGVGPALAGGEVVKTFPNEADHVTFVSEGSQKIKGQPYGDAAREGGQRTAATGGMPAFAGQLTEEELTAVVLYEREGL